MTRHRNPHATLGRLRERAACLYWVFAQGAASRPELRDLWMTLARDKEGTARTHAAAGLDLPSIDAQTIERDGFQGMLASLELHLSVAEGLGASGGPESQLIAALDLETAELDFMRAVPSTSGGRGQVTGLLAHVVQIAMMVSQYSNEAHVLFYAASTLRRLRDMHRADGGARR